MSRIHRLEAENFRRLKAVAIDVADGVVRITGPNGAGKTSLIDTLAVGIGGKAAGLPQDVTVGQASSRITVAIGDQDVELIIRRTISADGRHTLKVTTPTGASAYTKPQALLDGLVGAFSFDPLAFLRLPPRGLAAQLQTLVGLDTAPFDLERERLAREKAAAEQRLTVAQQAVLRLPCPESAPAAPVDTAALVADLEAALATVLAWQRLEAAVQEQSRSVDALTDARAEYEERVEKLLHELAGWREAIATVDVQLAEQRGVLSDQRATADAAKAVLPAPEPLQEQLRQASAQNDAYRQKREHASAEAAARAVADDVASYRAKTAEVEARRREAIAGARFPVEGLGFDAAGFVTWRDLPFSQASHAEQLRVAVAIGFASNPKLRVLLVRDGSLLDARSLQLLAELAAQYQGQVWLECVGDDAPCGFIVEEGEVREARAAR